MFKKIILIFVFIFGFSSFFYANAIEGDPDDSSKITSEEFMLKVNDISPGINVGSGNIKETANKTLATIIQTLMVALGSLALLIMTVGAGYIILHNGQDELLSKGKTIFMSGVYALIVALGSYYLISIVRFILYSTS